MGFPGAAQVARIQRTRLCSGPAFVADHIINPSFFAAKLSTLKDALSESLRSVLPAKVRKILFNEDETELKREVPPSVLAGALNKLAKGPSLYDPARFPDKVLSPETLELKGQNLKGRKLAQFNRLLLRDAYPDQISTEPAPENVLLATSREAGKLGDEDFLMSNRGYWAIENGAHQRLDCSALEDRLRVRDVNAVTVLGLFNRVSLTLYVHWAKTQPNQRDRTYPTWQSHNDGNRWRMIRQVTKPPKPPG